MDLRSLSNTCTPAPRAAHIYNMKLTLDKTPFGSVFDPVRTDDARDLFNRLLKGRVDTTLLFLFIQGLYCLFAWSTAAAAEHPFGGRLALAAVIVTIIFNGALAVLVISVFESSALAHAERSGLIVRLSKTGMTRRTVLALSLRDRYAMARERHPHIGFLDDSVDGTERLIDSQHRAASPHEDGLPMPSENPAHTCQGDPEVSGGVATGHPQ